MASNFGGLSYLTCLGPDTHNPHSDSLQTMGGT